MSLLTDHLEKLPADTVHWLALKVFGVSIEALHHEWLDGTAGECPCQRYANSVPTTGIPSPREEPA